MGNRLSNSRQDGELEEAIRSPLLGIEQEQDGGGGNFHSTLSSGRLSPAEDTDEFESLDFAPIHSRIFASERRRAARLRHFYGYTGRTLAKWSCTLAIGIMTGLVAFIVELFADVVRDHKLALSKAAMVHQQLLLPFLYYVGYGTAVVVITSIVVIYYAPAASGGGVTLVIAHLNGIHIPELLAFRTLCVKIVGTMCAITSGLAVGPEGPFVHIGAAIASQFTSLSARFTKLDLKKRSVKPKRPPFVNGLGPSSSHTGATKELPPSGLATAPEPHVDGADRESFPVPAGSGPAEDAPCRMATQLSTSPTPLSWEASSSSSMAGITITPSLTSENSISTLSRQGSLTPRFDTAVPDERPHAVESALNRGTEITMENSAALANSTSFPRCFPGNILDSIDAPQPIQAPPSHVIINMPRKEEEITPVMEPSALITGQSLTRSLSSPAIPDNSHFDMERINVNQGPEPPVEFQQLEKSAGSFPSSLVRRVFPWFYQPPTEALDFHNDLDCREFISAGSAAGLAAAFGAPVGGVLFSLEEASSFWSRKVMWRSLLCSTVACLTLSLLRGSGGLVRTGLLAFHSLRPMLAVSDLPFFVFTAAATGLLGGLFSWVHDWLSHFRVPQNKRFARIVEAAAIIMLSITAMFMIPFWFGNCLPQPDVWKAEDFGVEFFCSQHEGHPKQYNDMATLFFSIPDESIKKLLELSGRQNVGDVMQVQFTMRTLVIFAGVYFVLFQLAYGMAMPGGLFMPSTLLGASFGALQGMMFEKYLPGWKIQPGHHALIGATAMLGGIFRGSVSLVVIMVEGTGGIDFIFPIITAIVVSNYVAGHFGHMGAYESDLDKLRNVSFLQSEPPHALVALQAADLMSRNIVGFDKVVRVREVLQKLRYTRHNGFPVYTMTDGSGSSKRHLIGLILRSQLMTLLEQRAFISYRVATGGYSHQLMRHMEGASLWQPITTREVLLNRAMRVYHLFHYPYNRHLSSRSDAVDALNLDWVEQGRFGSRRSLHEVDGDGAPEEIIDTDDLALDLRPFMNHAPLCVRQECSAHRVYIIFRTLGQRHLPVIDAESKVVGIITRKDLAKASRIDHSRRTGDRSGQFGLPHWEDTYVDLYSLP